MNNSTSSLQLHHCHVHKLWAFLNQTYIILHFLALTFIFYYRSSPFFFHPKNSILPFFPWFSILCSELVYSFLWMLKQPIFWRPVTRTVFPNRLPKDEEKLPSIDVFIFTADPKKEPTLEVMNTVISAMILDYPARKLNVYLSDDGGDFVTLEGLKQGFVFATWWLPFCKRFNVKSICPQAYFEKDEGVENQSRELIEQRKIVKDKYEVFKRRLRSNTGQGGGDAQDHSAAVQVINGKTINTENESENVGAGLNPVHVEMPLLVYVSREKKPFHPHNFKAGAISVLLRISSTLSNSPYILILDCDMYCNDPSSARQAMCFYLDDHPPNFSSSLGWVQFPQKFHNINDADIYDSQIRTTWPIYWSGANGLQGPVLCGTNFYVKREALFGTNNVKNGNNSKELREIFGTSNEFLKFVCQNEKPNRELTPLLQQEAKFLASSNYEKDTKWGKQVGFRYNSLTEDVMTSVYLQSKGWRSVFLNPKRPQFLGSATTNLNQTLIQCIRWYAGLLETSLNEYSPLFHYPSQMQFLQRLFFSWVGLLPLDGLPTLCFATIPSLCFLYGIPLYPKVSDPTFGAYAFVFIASRLKHIREVQMSGGTLKAWMNEHRMWAIKAVTSSVYGTLECVMAKIGLRQANFTPTDKTGGQELTKYYDMGMYDFRASNIFLIPLLTIVTLNMVCFVGGFVRVIVGRNWDVMFVQMIFSSYLLLMSIPVIEGMVLRKDSGRVPSSSTLMSIGISLGLLMLGYFTFKY